MIGVIVGAWTPTDQSRRWARLVEEASRRMGFNRDELAEQMGLTAKQLSDQLTQKQPLNLWRLSNVAGFLRKFCEVLAEQEGLLVLDRNLVSMVLTIEGKSRHSNQHAGGIQ